jgi:subtilisin family serine protease
LNLRWLSSFSFKLLLPLLICGCADLIGADDSADLGSKSACAGDGGLVPSPVGPQSYVAYEKYSLPNNVLQKSKLPADTPLSVVVDEKCVMSRNDGAISQLLRNEISRQSTQLHERAYTLQLPASYPAFHLQNLVMEDPCLLHISEEGLVTLNETVDDPQLNLQIHLDNIEAFDAWDILHAGLTGSTVIAIIDDGIQMDHPDLSGALWVNDGEIASNGIDDDGNGYIDDVNGYNFAAGNPSPAHQNGASHGTHVAGLAAAIGNNGVGVTGVMGRNAEIMVLNVFGSAAGASQTNVVNAINYARDNGARVINMSLGGSGTATSYQTAMTNAVAAGVFIAASAGNDNRLISAAGFYRPAGYAKDISGAMAVGSIDATASTRSSFSNYSTDYVEISAPGSNSATGGVRSTYTGSSYSYLQGTSMSSPVLAGAAALVIGWATATGKASTPAQIEAIIRATATSNPDLSSYFLNGGQLNLKALADRAICNL